MAKRPQSDMQTRPAAGWVALRYLGALWQELRRQAGGLPTAAWRAWAQVTLGGLAITCALAAGLTLLARAAAPRGLQAWDERALGQLLAAPPFSFSTAVLLESPGNLIGMVLLVGAAVLLALRAGQALVAATTLALYWLGTALLWVAWMPWSRERPDLVFGGAAAPGLHSLPSGHTLHTIAVYGFLAYLWCRASASWLERALVVALCGAWTALVALARLRLGAHWPSDTVAGALVGLAWLAVGIIALRKAEAAGRDQRRPGGRPRE